MESAARLKAAGLEGTLRVAAQSAQARVHQVEAKNAALRQTLHDVTELARCLIQVREATSIASHECARLCRQWRWAPGAYS